MKLLSDRIQLSPTDLSNHLGCRHLTSLNRLLALDKIDKPSWTDPALAVLAQRGEEHEQAYVKHLESQGLTVESHRGMSVDATIDAMQRGVDIIVQAPLSHNTGRSGRRSGHSWMGYADILCKVGTSSALGNWSYEVQDTKLSRHTRAATILQLSLYSEIVGLIQDREPEHMCVVKPSDLQEGQMFDVETYRFADFKAYYRQAKTELVNVMEGEIPATYPEPVEQCNICRWWKECDRKRRSDDHLSFVASIRSMHIGELGKQAITTLEQFAKREDPLVRNPSRGNIESYNKIHRQAKIQLKGRLEDKLLYEFLPVEKGRGFSRLPHASCGDIYFDIEGDPFFERQGLEYLLGYAFIGDDSKPEYHKLWAKNRKEEKEAFDRFMNFLMARLVKYPDMHIYHFAPYEPSTIKRLSLRHNIHEEGLDRLLRAERFVDLHSVAKEGLRASVERYSLKDLERFTSYVRKVPLPTASAARRSVEFALELGDYASLTKEVLALVQAYNEDDCQATYALHLWLEGARQELVAQGKEIFRPELKTGDATEAVEEQDVRSKSIFDGLTNRLPEDPKEWGEHDRAQWLLANQVNFFRRENKSAYWEFFYLHELGYDDLMEERKGIAGLRYIGNVPLTGRKKSPVHRYTYPPQEVGVEPGSSLYEVMGGEIGTVVSISQETCTLEIKKTDKSRDIHPLCVHERKIVSQTELTNAICDIANSVILDGMDSLAYRAGKDLLMKRGPRLTISYDGKLLHDGEDVIDGAVRVASQLKFSVLGIQGPPGSGKTHTGAMMILKLAQQGKRIGVTALSHKVVINLFEKVLELGAKNNIPVSLVHKGREGDVLPSGIERAKDNKQALHALVEKKVVGGTAWLWASDDARETVDYLFVDEAGQMSLAHVLAASRAARNLVLLGDPQQLEQPQRASHPEGADVAALSHLLDGHHTMPDHKGIFLAVTRRLHPRITRFTSEVFYEGRLRSLPGLDKQIIYGTTPFAGAGLFYVPVQHEGNQNRADEEVEVIARIVYQLTSSVVTWTNASGRTLPLIKEDILIVAPYNAQVAALTERLPACRIGTVDKFQGQEAAVVIYSMTSSSPQEAPRGMGFLYNPNRLNVATSRAQCVTILLASEKLLQADCHTVDQMRWANALCRYAELARRVEP